MSERDPDRDPYWRDPRPPPAWPEETGTSVFGPPTRPHQPHQPPAHRDPGPYGNPHDDSYGDRPAGPPPNYPDPPPTYPDRYPDPPSYPGPPPAPPYPGERRPPRRPPDRAPGHAARQSRSSRRPGSGPPSDERRRPQHGPSSPGIGFPFGVGALFGVAGLVCFLLALIVLPWFEAGSEDVTLADIRSAFTIPRTEPDALLPDSGETTTTAPGALPTPGQVTDAVEEHAKDAAATAAAAAIDTGKARYLELYTETLWIVVTAAVSSAVLFSTILAPRSMALSLLLGFRRLSGVVIVLAGIAHGVALWIVFSGTGAPTPALGVWLGVAGLAAILLGCILGPKRRG